MTPSGDSQERHQREEEHLSVSLGTEPRPAVASFKPVPGSRLGTRRLRRAGRRLLRGAAKWVLGTKVEQRL